MAPLPIEVVFLLGVAGAAAPEILRLYELRTKPDEFKWSWSYMFLTIPFLLLGGLAAVILPTTTLWGAFYAGVSLPITLSVAAKKVLDLPGLGLPADATPGVATGGSSAELKGFAQEQNPQPMQGLRAYVHALL